MEKSQPEKEGNEAETKDEPDYKKQARAKFRVNDDPTVLNCKHHEDVQAQGVCAISGDAICETCIREDEGLIFSKEYFSLYLSNNWKEVCSVITTPDTPEKSMHLYQIKEEKWQSEQIPLIISIHYKIDVDQDIVESHVRLLATEDHFEIVKNNVENHTTKDSLH